MNPKTIRYLFVCYRNRNRSPKAAEVFQNMLVEAGYKVWDVNVLNGADFEVCSAGTYADEDGNPMREELGERMDVIFAMSTDILEDLVTHFHVPHEKVINLEIPDIYDHRTSKLTAILKQKLEKYIPRR